MSATTRNNADPPSPAAERNVWNNIPSAEDVNEDRSRGRQIAAITALLVVIAVTLAMLLTDDLAGFAGLLER